jgi:hypothetical protein
MAAGVGCQKMIERLKEYIRPGSLLIVVLGALCICFVSLPIQGTDMAGHLATCSANCNISGPISHVCPNSCPMSASLRYSLERPHMFPTSLPSGMWPIGCKDWDCRRLYQQYNRDTLPTNHIYYCARIVALYDMVSPDF